MKGFASSWLLKGAIYPQLIEEEPHVNTGVIVVIPAYAETGILRVLDSLGKCDRPSCETEVIIIVNAPGNAGSDSLAINKETSDLLESLKKEQYKTFFRLYYFNTGASTFRDWGVGMARKTGMDEALRRFSAIGNKEGIIVNLDADCVVDKNYLTEIENAFKSARSRNACSIYFEHDTYGDDFTSRQYESIIEYELHLRYYNTALRFAGYPYVHHTVGSSLAVKTSAYMKAGGMNRKQAGEDFYFIQKLIPLGGYFNLNTTTVRPSARESFRVPFGTGAAMSKLSAGENFETYNPLSFLPLRKLFSLTGQLYNGLTDLSEIEVETGKPLQEFLGASGWAEKMEEIRENTASLSSFEKRFFEWFNMFRIMKYLNYVHKDHYVKIDAYRAALELTELLGAKDVPLGKRELLNWYRSTERTL